MKIAKESYEHQGFKTVPIRSVKDKTPAVKGWNDPSFQWNSETIQHEGIGILTGDRSGLTVIDFDAINKSGAVTQTDVELYNNLKENLEPLCSVIVKTQNNGFHFYFIYDQRLRQTQSLFKGVDVRNDGGYVVAPPTPGYEFVKGNSNTPLTPLPYDYIASLIKPKLPPSPRETTDSQMRKPDSQLQNNTTGGKTVIPKHSRNEQVCQIFGRFKAAELSGDEALAAFSSKYEIEWGDEWTPDFLETKICHFWSEGVWDIEKPSLRNRIKKILSNKEIDPLDKNLLLAETLLPYIYVTRNNEYYLLESDNDAPTALPEWLSGIGMTSVRAKELCRTTESVAKKKCHNHIAADYYYFDRTANRIFFNTTSGVIQVDENGHRYGNRPSNVIFLKKYEYTQRAGDSFSDLLKLVYLDTLRTPVEMAEGIMRCMVMSVIFNLNTRPMLLIEGNFSSGKTTLALTLVKSLVPDSEPQKINKKDFTLQLSKYSFCVLDNVEAKYDDEIRDVIAMCSTGGMESVRKLYTDSEMIERKMSANVIFTSKSGEFSKRPDIASRLIPIHLKPNFDFDDIDVPYWASVVFHDILDHLPTVLKNKPIKIKSKLRNASFVSFCARCGFDITKYADLILDSQTNLGEYDFVNDLITVLDKNVPSETGTDYLPPTAILYWLMDSYPDKYGRCSSQTLGYKLKQIESAHQLSSKYIVQSKVYNEHNHLYRFERITS